MHFSATLLAAIFSSTLTSAAVVTQIDYVTQYQYEQVNVIVDNSGVPYSTQTFTTSTGIPSSAPESTTPASSGPASVDPTSSAPSPASVVSAPSAAQNLNFGYSHSHNNNGNYASVTPTFSNVVIDMQTSSGSSSTPSAPAEPYSSPSSSTTSAFTSSAPPPAQSTSAPTTSTSSTIPAKTTSTSSAPSSGSGGSFSGDATFYAVGLGACGVTNTDSDMIAALNVEQFNQFGSMSNGNPVCGKQATLNYQGKSVTVTIQDKCPGCKYGDLDLSPAAFSQLADQAAGRIHMTWSFI